MAKKSEDFGPLYEIVDGPIAHIKGYLYNGHVPINPDFKFIYIFLHDKSIVIKDSPLDVFIKDLDINPPLTSANAPSIQFQSIAEIFQFIANGIQRAVVFRKYSRDDYDDYQIYIRREK